MPYSTVSPRARSTWIVVVIIGLLIYLTTSLVMCIMMSVGRPNYLNYFRIHEGMDIRDVESILGPGRELTKNEIPNTPDFSEPVPENRSKPVVRGDKILFWEGSNIEIYIGFNNNKVSTKWLWQSSP